MEPSRLALGVGRVGVDHLVTTTATGERFDSKKISCVPSGRRLSGSVPTILQAAASHPRVFARMVVPSVESSRGRWVQAQLRAMGLEIEPETVDSLVDSLVVHDGDGRLSTILVLEETGDSTLSADVGRRLSLDEVTVVVADGHQVDATLALAERCRDSSTPLFFDPGSTFASPRRSDTIAAIAPLSTVVVASEDFSSRFQATIDSLAATRKPSQQTKLWIVTHHDGSLTVVTPGAASRIPASPVTPRGSSLGVGDLFRGTLLRELLTHGALDRDAKLVHATVERFALEGQAVALWRLEIDEPLPRTPTSDELVPFRARVGLS